MIFEPSRRPSMRPFRSSDATDSALSRPTRRRADPCWLRDWYGDALFTIGFYAYRGIAADNSREEYAVPEATPANLEYRLARAGYRVSFVDLERQGWAASYQTLRYNGRHDQRMVPARQYDALILIADVGPPGFLY